MSKRVFIKSITCIREEADCDSFVLNEKQKVLSSKWNGSSFMTKQNAMLCMCVEEVLKQANIDSISLKEAGIFIGNGGISPSKKMLTSLIRFSGKDEDIDYECLSQNIDKIPPLEGVRNLPTAADFFLAKNFDIHNVGNPMYLGDDSGLLCLFRAQENVQLGKINTAVVAASDHKDRILQKLFSLTAGMSYCSKNGACAMVISNMPNDCVGEILEYYDEWLPEGVDLEEIVSKHLIHFTNKERISQVVINTKCSDIENRCCAICKQFFPKSIKCFNKYLGYRGTASGLSNLYLGLSELKSQESLLLISVNPGGLIGSIVVKKI